jgi:D-arabinose 1-dehydrogenase-like Zn-dependent alcohol dehydrogenase
MPLDYKQAKCGLGHEGAGIVEKVGPEVTFFKVGDRAGWGYNHNCCGHCEMCDKGLDTLCEKREMFGIAHLDQGSFASHGVWREDFVFHIPDEIDSPHAAPLMCGGATVFNALYNGGLRSTDRVGVIGVGGLGHLAIQFAKAMGCTVVVFSGSDSKKEEARKLGASEFYAMKGVTAETVEKLGCKPVQHFVVTTSAKPDWGVYMPLLAPLCVVYPLTVDEGDFAVPAMEIILKQLRIQGVLVADRGTHKRMLDFAARHGVRPMINEFKMNEQGIEDAFAALTGGKMRYRGVLVAE